MHQLPDEGHQYLKQRLLPPGRHDKLLYFYRPFFMIFDISRTILSAFFPSTAETVGLLLSFTQLMKSFNSSFRGSLFSGFVIANDIPSLVLKWPFISEL